MKKQLLTLLVVLFLAVGSMQAQGTVVATSSNGTFELVKEHADEDFVDYIKTSLTVRNLTNTPLFIKARRMASNMAYAHENYFCWDVCYDPTVSASINAVMVPANGSVSNFYVIFTHYNVPGNSNLTMRFFDENETEDYAESNLDFAIGATSIADEIDAARALSAPYPNPTKDFAYINTDLPNAVQNVELKVFNLIGREVSTIPVQDYNGKIEIDTRNYVPGVYFLYLFADNREITSRKLIVTR